MIYALYDPVNDYIGYIGISGSPDFRYLQHLKDYELSFPYRGQACIVNSKQDWFGYLKMKDIMFEMFELPPANFDVVLEAWAEEGCNYKRLWDDSRSEQYYIKLACQEGHRLANTTYNKQSFDLSCPYSDCVLCSGNMNLFDVDAWNRRAPTKGLDYT